MPFLAYPLELIPYVIISLLIAFTIHEFAHASVAYKFGDPTAKNQGRLTLSPLAHLDPIGTLFIFLAGFGWARPVPVNRFYFKKPRLAGILVSIAGPLSNFFLAVIGIIVYMVSVKLGMISIDSGKAIGSFLNIFISLNIMLFIFNLLPFPPLDGYRIIEDLVPIPVRAKMTQYEGYGIIIFLILVITPLDQYTIHPLLYDGVPFVVDSVVAILRPLINF